MGRLVTLFQNLWATQNQVNNGVILSPRARPEHPLLHIVILNLFICMFLAAGVFDQWGQK